MPELPEVETIRRGLEKTIVGKTIASVDVRLPKIISIGPKTVSNVRNNGRGKAVKFEKLLRGQKITAIKRRSKMLLIKLRPLSSSPLARGEGKTWLLLIHLKMTGQLIYAKTGERKVVKLFNAPDSRRLALPHKSTRVIFSFRDGSRLYFNDLRQFGYIRLVRDEAVSQIRELQEYGPEPLGRDFHRPYWQDKLRARPNLTVKQFLMDPKVVAGVGNIYSDEILYCAAVLPQRKVRTLKLRQAQRLFRCIPKVLREALHHHGSSVGDYFRVDGSEGDYGRVHRVYGRGGAECRKCGSIIKTVKLGGRTSSYCPVCQK